MISAHAYQGCRISVECKAHRVSAQQSVWSATFAYTLDGVVVQQPVQACVRQKTVEAARDKALRFAIIAIDARAEGSIHAPRARRTGGATENKAGAPS